eukprot:g60008.t1
MPPKKKEEEPAPAMPPKKKEEEPAPATPQKALDDGFKLLSLADKKEGQKKFTPTRMVGFFVEHKDNDVFIYKSKDATDAFSPIEAKGSQSAIKSLTVGADVWVAFNKDVPLFFSPKLSNIEKVASDFGSITRIIRSKIYLNKASRGNN